LKRFRFRLAQVQRVRELQEDQARAALLTAHRRAHDAATQVDASLAEYARRSFPPGPLSNDQFERSLFLLDTAAGMVGVARAAHSDALATVEIHREEWTAARRRVAVLERLEERRRAEHELDARRAEDRLTDDLVIARFGGRR
jgi:flagellar biosynthesis chaperone FliJ